MPVIPPYLSRLAPLQVSGSGLLSAATSVGGGEDVAQILAKTALIVAPGAVLPPANPLEGLSHFMSLAERRDRFWGPQVQRLRGKLVDIVRLDRESAVVIAREALQIRQPNSLSLQRLIWAVHKTHTRLNRWPARVKREGPLAAFYIRRRNDAEGRDRLQRQLLQPSTLKIAFEAETGAFAVTDRPFASKIDPMAMVREDDEAAANLTPELFEGLSRVFAHLYDGGLADARRDYQNLCRRVCVILRHDPRSLAAWLKGFAAEREAGRMDGAQWKRYRRGLYAAADFLGGWRARVSWTGDPVAYFLANGQDLKTLRAFYHRVEKGDILSIRFEGGRAELEKRFPVRRQHTMAPTGYSYGDSAEAHYLPGPFNGWGEKDFGLPEERIVGRIRNFFEALENKLDLTPAVIQRSLKIPYYSIRTARTGMAPAYLEDRFLNRLEMSPSEKERLRHFQTLLAIARDRRNDVEKGPYHQQGRLLWYYRWLHQIPYRKMLELYRDGVAQEGATEIELGRARVGDRDKLRRIAESVGVPHPFLEKFVSHVMDGYETVHRRVSGAADAPTSDFPNEGWAVPFSHLSDGDIEAQLLRFRETFASTWTRADMIHLSGLGPSRAHALALQGTLWAAALEATFRGEERFDQARQLQVLRAAHELRRKPVEDRAGYHRAGRLLRFARLMMPGWAAEDVIRELKLDLRTPAYTYWEWGFTKMPEKILKAFSRLLAKEGVLSPGQAASFEARLRALYTR